MQVNITARRVELTEPFKMFVNEKLAKLTRHNSKIEKARAVFSLEKLNYVSDVVLAGRNLKIASTEKDTELKASFDKCLGNIEKRLKRLSGRAREHKIRGFTAGLSKLKPKKQREAVIAPSIIKTDSFAAKPMSPEDAASELDIFGKEFIVFRNSDTENVNVIYRRKDGNYGLIEP